jgi:stringent starvation protein B
MVPVYPLLARTGAVCTAAVDAIRARENAKRVKITVKKEVKEEVKKEKNSGPSDSARTHDANNSDSDHGTDPGYDSDSDSEDELFLYLSQDTAEIISSD